MVRRTLKSEAEIARIAHGDESAQMSVGIDYGFASPSWCIFDGCEYFSYFFAQRVREILSRVDGLDDFARAAQGKLSGRFRLGVIPTIAPYL